MDCRYWNELLCDFDDVVSRLHVVTRRSIQWCGRQAWFVEPAPNSIAHLHTLHIALRVLIWLILHVLPLTHVCVHGDVARYFLIANTGSTPCLGVCWIRGGLSPIATSVCKLWFASSDGCSNNRRAHIDPYFHSVLSWLRFETRR